MSETFLRLPEVQRRVPYSRSTIYLLIARGEFPKPHSLGARAVAWLESDIDDWMAERIAIRCVVTPVALAVAKGKNRAGVSA